jgi:hypothetical protein
VDYPAGHHRCRYLVFLTQPRPQPQSALGQQTPTQQIWNGSMSASIA